MDDDEFDRLLDYKEKQKKIKKGQSGMKFADYLKKYKAESAAAGAEVKDMAGSFSDMNALEWASLIGAGASFIPGVGAIGAGVTTIADIINDATDGDGKVNWMNHAANAGFIGLSAIGLGGLRAAKGIAKGVDKAVAFGFKNSDDMVKLITKFGKRQAVSNADIAKIAIAHPELIGKSAKTGKLFLNDAKQTKAALEKSLAYVNMLNSTKKTATVLDKAGKVARVAMAVPVGAAAIGSGVSVVKDAVEGGFGNIQSTDVKNLLYAGSLTKGFLADRAQAKTFNKFVNKKTNDDVIEVFKGKKSLGVIKEDVIPKKSVVTKAKNTVGKGKMSEKDAADLAKKLEDAGMDKEILKKLGVEDMGKLSTKVTKGGTTVEGFDVKAPNTTQQDFEVARKLLIGKATHGNPKSFEGIKLPFSYKGQPITLQKGGLIPKFQSSGQLWQKRPMTEAEIRAQLQRRNQPGGTVNTSAQVQDPWGSQTSVSGLYGQKEGTGLGVAAIQDNTLAPWQKYSTKENPILHKEPKYEIGAPKSILPSNMDIHKAVQTNQKISTSPEEEGKLGIADWMTDEAIWNKGTPVKTAAEKPFDIKAVLGNTDPKLPAITGDGYSTQKGNKNKFSLKGLNIDPATISNLAGYFSTLRANNKATQAQKRAAMAGIVKAPLISRRYFRADSPYSSFYDREANKLHTIAGTLGRKTADFDKGASIALEAAGQASDLRAKGMQLDQQHIQNKITQQGDSDFKTSAFNTQQMEKTMGSLSGAEKMIHQLDANKYVANNSAFNNLLLAENRNKQVRDQKKRWGDLYDTMTDPAYKEHLTSYSDISKKLSDFEKQWEKDGETQPDAWKKDRGNIDDNIDYKNLKGEMDRVKVLIDDFQFKMRNAQLATQMPYGSSRRTYDSNYYAKGGTLPEREYLVRLRSQLQKESVKDKRVYEQILKNNELMQKSLIKVFK